MNICVFGSSSDLIDREFLDSAEKLGSELAKKGTASCSVQENSALWEQPHEVFQPKTALLSA